VSFNGVEAARLSNKARWGAPEAEATVSRYRRRRRRGARPATVPLDRLGVYIVSGVREPPPPSLPPVQSGHVSSIPPY
jgi:hypothetical protein